MKQTTRRAFLQKTAQAGMATLITIPAANTLLAASTNHGAETAGSSFGAVLKTGFDQSPLPYPVSALEPSIDEKTMDIHYSKHAAAYCKNLKEAAAAENVDTSKPVEDLLGKISKYSPKMRNNGGGHYNHELFWKCMQPAGGGQPTGKLLAAIEKDFGSVDALKKKLTEAAMTRFGSGWAWLLLNSDKKLLVTSTANQDNPLMDIAEVKGLPLLGLDVWEHAYYLKYQNRRAEYVENFWKIVNWNQVGERYSGMA